jgi:hypothetical protein
MNEQGWLGGTDRNRLLDFILPQASLRQRLLLACACLRRVWPLLDDLCRRYVATLERWADREAGLPLAEQWAETRATPGLAASGDRAEAARLACALLDVESMTAGEEKARDLVVRAAHLEVALELELGVDDQAASRRQAGLLRELFGNPFRPSRLDPAWRRGHDSVAERLARAIYAERRFDELPVLADALEDAGCADRAILAHCRGPGEHVLGCWVVDLLLGKS